MSPVTHFVGSWMVATVTTDNPRDRKLVTWAGVLPDLDGLGAVADVAVALATGKECTFQYYQQYHHELGHGWPAALVVAGLLALMGRKKWHVFAWCLVTFHLHLLCDLLGSRGPSAGDLWPISYSEPVFRLPVWFWHGQWRLDGWQNRLITVSLFLGELALAARRGYSVVEIFSRKVDAVFVAVLQKWRAAF